MSNLSVFLKTKVEDSGILSYIGNKGLAPARYLFKGQTYQIKKDEMHRVLSFTKNERHSRTNRELVSSQKSMFKTAASVILFIPGLLLSLFKLGAYIFSDVREKHQSVKKAFTPINVDIGTVKEPIVSEDDLRNEIDVARSIHKCQTVNAVIIHGDGNLEINKEAGILSLQPRRLILEGAEVVHKSCNGTRLDDAMAHRNWYTVPIRLCTADPNKSSATGKNITTVAEALKAPLERKGKWPSQQFYNGLFIVPRPITAAAG